jgi:dolichol-phosphate mannosyltransferase
MFRAGLVVREVPIVFRDRRVGQSKMSGAIMAEALVKVAGLAVRGWSPRGGA